MDYSSDWSIRFHRTILFIIIYAVAINAVVYYLCSCKWNFINNRSDADFLWKAEGSGRPSYSTSLWFRQENFWISLVQQKFQRRILIKGPLWQSCVAPTIWIIIEDFMRKSQFTIDSTPRRYLFRVEVDFFVSSTKQRPRGCVNFFERTILTISLSYTKKILYKKLLFSFRTSIMLTRSKWNWRKKGRIYTLDQSIEIFDPANGHFANATCAWKYLRKTEVAIPFSLLVESLL